MTAKNGYISTRDKIIGSTIWGRKVETIIYLNREGGKETDEITVMTILPRNAPVEEHKLRLVGGQLHLISPEAQERAQMSKNEMDMLEWIQNQETFTRADCKKKFTSMNGTKLTERLDGFQKAGLIKQRTKGARVWYDVPSNLVAPQATKPRGQSRDRFGTGQENAQNCPKTRVPGQSQIPVFDARTRINKAFQAGSYTLFEICVPAGLWDC